MSVQMFFRGQRVKVQDTMPTHMAHFPAGFEAIVVGSYSDLYQTHLPADYQSFTLLQLQDEKPVNTIAWYDDHQLTLLSNDRVAGEALLRAWKERAITTVEQYERQSNEDCDPKP